MEVIKRIVDGLTGEEFIKWFNKRYNTDYGNDLYYGIIRDADFKEKRKIYEEVLTRKITTRVTSLESKEIAKTVVKSKDVLRSAIFKMGDLLGTVDKIDVRDDQLVRNTKLKYGDYPRLMKELRETIKLLNELEGSGETITIDDIMSKFKRNGEGELDNNKISIDPLTKYDNIIDKSKPLPRFRKWGYKRKTKKEMEEIKNKENVEVINGKL